MAEFYRFFDSTLEDKRLYNADEFAEYFRRVLTDGIFNGGLNLKASTSGTDMNVDIADGFAWVKGYLYKVEGGLTLPIEQASATKSRIDRIVLRWDKREEARYIKAFVVKGVESDSPVPPEITRTEDVHELSLAQVFVEAGKSFLQADSVTDERLNAELCGLVNSLIQADTTEIFNQFDNWYKTNIPEFEQRFNNWFSTNIPAYEGQWTNWYNTKIPAYEKQWDDWFAGQSSEGLIPMSEKGAVGGVATLDETGKVPALQLPAMDYVPTSEKGVANGVATLDGNGKVPLIQLQLPEMVASNVTVADGGNLYNATDVEGALQEVMTKANSAFQSASDGKNLLAPAITGKGVPTNASDTFATMATNITNIKVGKYNSGDKLTDANMMIDTTKGRGKNIYLATSNFYEHMALDNSRKALYGCGTQSDSYLTKHMTDTGEKRWTLTGGKTGVVQCAVASTGKIYVARVASTYNLLIVDPSGTIDKELTVSESVSAIKIDKFDNIYICGYKGTSYTLQKHTTDGTKVWEKTVGSRIWAIDCDEQGNVYCAMATSTGNNTVYKFNPQGGKLWGVLTDTVERLKVAPNGNIGVSVNSSVYLLNPANGSTILSFSVSEKTRAIAFDSGNHIYTSHDYTAVRRYDSQKGTMLLEHTYYKNFYDGRYLLLDDEDKVYVAMYKTTADNRLLKTDMLNYYTLL